MTNPSHANVAPDPSSLDRSSRNSLLSYAKQLEGMTFHEVLDLGIYPEDVEPGPDPQVYKGKGGMGTLLEERFFAYRANSDQAADFADAGVELKATCYDLKKNGDPSAGERLVLTMIPFDGPIEDDFYESHAWEKSKDILLIYYERDRNVAPTEQRIQYATLFTPSDEDLKIIEDDYDKIAGLVREGKGDQLSESLTTYLGACTKGATASTSWVNQFYPPHTPAKRRAFCLKRNYMDFVLHNYVMGQERSDEKIVRDASELEGMTFEELVLSKIEPYIGKTDRELCRIFGLKYTGNKAQWTRISYEMLGIRGDEAEEFKKANISVRTVRVRKGGGVKESLSLNTITFMELVDEEWDTAPLHEYFEETRFLFVSFQDTDDGMVLAGARFWSMPCEDIDGPLRECWERTQQVVREGVELKVEQRGDKEHVTNNLPAKTENRVAHVRPHAARAWYRFGDGSTRGDDPSCGDELPDGREMTRQSFWLNNDYVYEIVRI